MNAILQISQLSVDDFQRLLKQAISDAVEQGCACSTSGRDDEFYTREATAQKLKVSLSTLHNWSKSGILNHTKIGNRVYYARSEVIAKLKAAS
ncbi:helix-turn-helix domain-containing protein [Kaistella sp. PBT33-4]|uniref:helix-turn-helix domain-containing protein n=1 Tax=Kaistella sp. PBT33-4 TaxID=3032000 RepID=UPI0023D7EDD0|nr:helix-turn-helix domain-containing protein [Kaistella sp. PBT33-4]MDF0719190.1 helix-turn-helix domain-containing protein [Kaistella sp. PBT33-4]